MPNGTTETPRRARFRTRSALRQTHPTSARTSFRGFVLVQPLVASSPTACTQGDPCATPRGRRGCACGTRGPCIVHELVPEQVPHRHQVRRRSFVFGTRFDNWPHAPRFVRMRVPAAFCGSSARQTLDDRHAVRAKSLRFHPGVSNTKASNRSHPLSRASPRRGGFGGEL